MLEKSLPPSLKNYSVYLLGIKGTGMAAFAELLLRRGALVSGSDVEEKFYTDNILLSLNIPFHEGFSRDHINDSIQLLIHSSAYGDDHIEIQRAKEMNIPIMVYTEALGYISTLCDSFGIAGVHGKTTTTALAGTLAGAVSLEASILVGSAVPTFGGYSTAHFGDKYFIAETCEYMRHFLQFRPSSIVLTSIEPDHLDYFKDYDDILEAFLSYIDKLPSGGDLIYCCDDPGASEAAHLMSKKRDDINYIAYGETADGPYGVQSLDSEVGINSFRLRAYDKTFSLIIPGRHLQLDSAAALALIIRTMEKEGRLIDENLLDLLAAGLLSFRGSKRRSEVLGESKGILFMDDYAHHPTAIKTTLKGLREFYPQKRIIVDFMSHTYSRTAALFNDFAASFGSADVVLLHKIYGSAREKYTGTINGYQLYEKTCEYSKDVFYFDEFSQTVDYCSENLKEGDLFITMGAGNNWQIGQDVFKRFNEK